jgi:hypothetical protein
MAASYQTVDPTGALVAQSFPYARLFITFGAPTVAPLLMLWLVTTGPQTGQSIASVTLNGTKIGDVWYRDFWAGPSPEVIVVPQNVFTGWFQVNTLRITAAPPPAPNFGIILDKVILFTE